MHFDFVLFFVSSLLLDILDKKWKLSWISIFLLEI